MFEKKSKGQQPLFFVLLMGSYSCCYSMIDENFAQYKWFFTKTVNFIKLPFPAHNPLAKRLPGAIYSYMSSGAPITDVITFIMQI